jgi:DNA repair protein SbcC/Rad50
LLKSLSLSNFQSHKKSLLEFSPNVNSIIGSSNSGKTAILRALYWIIYNRPSGIDFVSHWNRDKKGNPVNKTSANIVFDNEEIERIKSEEQSGYLVNGKLLEAVGLSVPDSVSQLINMDEVNIQRQMDSPFLLSESPADVARFFNKIINLDLIDEVLSKAENKRRKLNASIESNQERKKSLTLEIENYNWLDLAESLFEKIDNIETKNKELIEKKEAIYSLMITLNGTVVTKNKYEKIINDSDIIIEKLERFIGANKEHEKKKAEIKTILMYYEEAHLVLVNTKGIEKASKIIEQIEEIDNEDDQDKKDLLQSIIETLETTEINIDKYKKQIDKLEKQLPDICPLCGGKIHG